MIDLATGKVKPLTAEADPQWNWSAAAWVDGGTGQSHAAVYSVKSAAWRWLKPTPWEQSAGAIAPDGRSMAADTGVDGRTTLGLVDLATMAERPLPLPQGVNSVANAKLFTPDSRRLLVLQSGATSPGMPVIVDLAKGQVRANRDSRLYPH